MTQNTEHKVRSRDAQKKKELALFLAASHTPLESHFAEAEAQIKEAEARGAEEQRRKDLEGQKPLGFINEHAASDLAREPDSTVANIYGAELPYCSVPVFARPVNVAALEAHITELVEAEQLARADAEAAMIDQYVAGARFGWACGRANDLSALKEKIDQKQKGRSALIHEETNHA